jgi:hypothetical protein
MTGFSSLRHHVNPGSGVHPASYLIGTVVRSPGVKQPGRDADHPYPLIAEVKNAWVYTSTPRMSSYSCA